MVKLFAVFFAAVLFSIFGIGCATTVENNQRTIQDLALYMMEKTGGTFDGPMACDPIFATGGFALKLADLQVAFYKFDSNRKKGKAKLDYVNENHYIYIYGFQFPAIAHGSFIMVDYEKNPYKDDLLKAFQSF